MSKYIISLIFFCAISAAVAHAQDYIPNQVLISFHDSTSKARSIQIHREIGAEIRKIMFSGKIHLVEITSGISVIQAIEKYKKFPEVRSASPNYVIRSSP